MPLPDPSTFEDQQSFMDACMTDMLQSHTRDQAIAACLETWRGKSTGELVDKAKKPDSGFAARISGDTGAVLVSSGKDKGKGPDPAKFDNKADFMDACMAHHGDKSKCGQMWDEHSSPKGKAAVPAQTTSGSGSALVGASHGHGRMMMDSSKFDNKDEFMKACMAKHDDESMCSDMWDQQQKGLKILLPGMKAMMKLERGWSTLKVKTVQEEQRIIEGIASTPNVDNLGDVVDPMGGTFNLPMPLLWQHRHDEPVGHVIAATPTRDGIKITAKFAKIVEPGGLKDLVDKAWQSVKAGLVRGLSIGFLPVEAAPVTSSVKGGGSRVGVFYKAYRLLEISLVTIPANSDATISVVKSCDGKFLKIPEKEEVPTGETSVCSDTTGKIHSVKLI
jgi:Escherichia/Staphylococcus phage prohead protease